MRLRPLAAQHRNWSLSISKHHVRLICCWLWICIPRRGSSDARCRQLAQPCWLCSNHGCMRMAAACVFCVFFLDFSLGFRWYAHRAMCACSSPYFCLPVIVGPRATILYLVSDTFRLDVRVAGLCGAVLWLVMHNNDECVVSYCAHLQIIYMEMESGHTRIDEPNNMVWGDKLIIIWHSNWLCVCRCSANARMRTLLHPFAWKSLLKWSPSILFVR